MVRLMKSVDVPAAFSAVSRYTPSSLSRTFVMVRLRLFEENTCEASPIRVDITVLPALWNCHINRSGFINGSALLSLNCSVTDWSQRTNDCRGLMATTRGGTAVNREQIIPLHTSYLNNSSHIGQKG